MSMGLIELGQILLQGKHIILIYKTDSFPKELLKLLTEAPYSDRVFTYEYTNLESDKEYEAIIASAATYLKKVMSIS